jgi:hypothetical protein
VWTRGPRGLLSREAFPGNRATSRTGSISATTHPGQFVLGQPLNGRNRCEAERLRTVAELYPEIADAAAGEDPLPSCSAVEVLERQEPFINQTLAASALAMLARLFRYGRICYHGGFFNAGTGQMSALPVDPESWRRTRRSGKNVACGG